MNNSFKVGALTYSRRPELFPDGRVLIDIDDPDGTWGMTAEQDMELAQFLCGGLDIYEMFMLSEMRKAHRGTGLEQAQDINDYNTAVINGCASIELCEQCQAQVTVDVKKQARKVRELNKILFEDISTRIERGQPAYSQVVESTQKIMVAMKGVEHICEACHTKQHEAIKREFFRIRQNKRYRESKEAKSE